MLKIFSYIGILKDYKENTCMHAYQYIHTFFREKVLLLTSSEVSFFKF